jgi:hypothetical protein
MNECLEISTQSMQLSLQGYIHKLEAYPCDWEVSFIT